MQRPIEKPVGTRVEELDTPALLLDLATFDANACRLSDPARPARAEAWVHKTPATARAQVRLSGISGIAVRSVAALKMPSACGIIKIKIKNIATACTTALILPLGRAAKAKPFNAQMVRNVPIIESRYKTTKTSSSSAIAR